jgi:hypothetical protein
VSDGDWARLDAALAAAGRSRDELELVTSILPALPPGRGPAKLTDSTEFLEFQLAQGFRTFVVNPGQFVETVEEIPAFAQELRRLVARSLP